MYFAIGCKMDSGCKNKKKKKYPQKIWDFFAKLGEMQVFIKKGATLNLVAKIEI